MRDDENIFTLFLRRVVVNLFLCGHRRISWWCVARPLYAGLQMELLLTIVHLRTLMSIYFNWIIHSIQMSEVMNTTYKR